MRLIAGIEIREQKLLPWQELLPAGACTPWTPKQLTSAGIKTGDQGPGAEISNLMAEVKRQRPTPELAPFEPQRCRLTGNQRRQRPINRSFPAKVAQSRLHSGIEENHPAAVGLATGRSVQQILKGLRQGFAQSVRSPGRTPIVGFNPAVEAGLFHPQAFPQSRRQPPPTQRLHGQPQSPTG